MKQIILALMLAVAGIGAAVAANPIREGNMISGHVLVKGSEENIPYATVLIVGSGQGTVSNEEGQFEFKNLPAGKYTLRVSAVEQFLSMVIITVVNYRTIVTREDN